MWTVWYCTVLDFIILIILPCVYSKDNDTDCKNGDVVQVPQFSHTPTSIVADLRETVEFNCAGNYGTADGFSRRDDRPIWVIVSVMKNCNIDCRVRNEIPTRIENEPDYPRYKVSKSTSQNGRVVRSKLTITNVSAQDYGIFLQCRLASSLPTVPCATVTILPYQHTKREIDIGLGLGLAVSLLIIVVLVILLAYCFYGPRISLLCYSKFGHMCVNDNPEKYACDVLVIHDEDDHSFVREHMMKIFERLENLRYRTMATHLSPEQPLFEGTQELITDSYCIMFIITPDILNEALYSHLLDVAMKLRRKIVLVEVHNEGHKLPSWETWNEKYSRSENLGNGVKYMKTIRWPGNKASQRQKTNFFCEIRRQLPAKANRIRKADELI